MKKAPGAIDGHVGARIRVRRQILGLSQEKLAEGLGITFQQVQKYEKGTNRVGASRLHDIAGVLGVDVAYFFEGAVAGPGTGAKNDLLIDNEGAELLRAFNSVEEPKMRKAILEVARAAARQR